MTEHAAFVDGEPVEMGVAAKAAARLLAGARLPLIAGLGTDIDGARAAIALAEQVRGVFDHMHSDALLNTLEPLREAGMMLTTPGEVRLRCDTVVLVGEGIDAAWPDIWTRLALEHAPQLALAPEPRRIFWIGAGAERGPPGLEIAHVAADDLPVALSMLRAMAGGRRFAGVAPLGLATCAAALDAAKIGCIVWPQAALDPLATQMVAGLVFDLNVKSRCSGLPLAPGGNAAGVLLASGWMTGFPPRTSFARGFAQHDPWLFESRRLLASGEADALLWIDAMGGEPPEWAAAPNMIVLAAAAMPRPPAVQFRVGTPGVDHAAVLHDAATGGLVAFEAQAPSARISVAAVINMIAAELGGAPCRP